MWYLLLGLGLAVLASMAYAAASGAPWVPTWKRDIARLERLAGLSAEEHFYELGCGDGRICTALSQRTGAHATGIELSVAQYLAARIRGLRTPRARFRFANAFSIDVSEADVVYMFLMPETYEKLRPKLERELRSGARVISYVWEIPGWTPTRVDRLEGAPSLYFYQR